MPDSPKPDAAKPDAARTVTACVLIIGNEILSGRTKDANLPFLAERLNEVGVRLMEARVIPDVPRTIIDTVNEVRGKFDYVITTGGIGPTHDDITSECVAAAFGLPLVRNPEAVRRLQAHYPPGGLNEARLRMTNTPEGATLIDNPISIAPGFQIGNVFVLAGVPSIMQAMFEGVKHRLVGGLPMLSRSVTSGLPEGVMAKDLGAIQDRFPEVEIGSYPFFRMGRPGASIVLRSTDVARLAMATDEVKEMMVALGDEPLELEA